jgi:hypothetical protein
MREITIELIKRVEPMFGIDGKARRRMRRKINRNNHQ